MAAYLLALLPLLQAADPAPRIERLGNGLRVAIVEDHALPLVSVQLWYRVGSADDALQRPGLCHVARTVLEHRDDAALKLRAAGVRFESKTLRDACYFSSLLPPNFLEYVLDIEAQRMPRLEVTAEMVKTALGAAARDFGLDPDDPEKLAERWLLAAMFPNHPYQHPPGFVTESLKDLQPVDVQEFLDRWFVPGNATLFIIGDVSTVQALELVRERFGKLPWREPPRRPEPPNLENEPVRREVYRRDHPELTIAWRTPPLAYFENAAIDVLMHGLLNEFDGPLYRALGNAGYQFPTPYWYHQGWRHGGWLVLRLGLIPYARRSPALPDEPEAIKRVLDHWLSLVEQELAAAEARIPKPIEHNRARAQAEREVLRGRLAFWDRALEMAEHEVVAGDILLAELRAPRLRNVAVADVQAAAMLLNESRRVVLQYRRDAAPARDAQVLSAYTPRRQLGPVELLDRLKPYATLAPQPVSPAIHPKVQFATIDERVPVATCQIPGTHQATVAFLHRWSGNPQRAVWVVPATRLRPRERRGDHGQMVDYAAYHAAVRQHLWSHLAGHGSPCGEIATGDPQCALAMLEWFAGIIPPDRARSFRQPVSSLSFEIFAVGDIQATDVIGAVQPVFTEQIGAEAGVEQQARSRPRRAGVRPPKVKVMGTSTDNPAAFANVLMSWVSAEDETVLNPLEARALSLLLGRAPLHIDPLDPLHVRPLDARTVPLWSDWTLTDLTLQARTEVDAAELEQTLRGFHRRLRAVETSAVPLEEVALALRLARVEQLVRLESPAAIIEELSWSRSDPWDIRPNLTAEQVLAKLAAACKQASLLISLVGGDEATHERLRDLEEPAN